MLSIEGSEHQQQPNDQGESKQRSEAGNPGVIHDIIEIEFSLKIVYFPNGCVC